MKQKIDVLFNDDGEIVKIGDYWIDQLSPATQGFIFGLHTSLMILSGYQAQPDGSPVMASKVVGLLDEVREDEQDKIRAYMIHTVMENILAIAEHETKEMQKKGNNHETEQK